MDEDKQFNAEMTFVDSDQFDPEQSVEEASGEWVLFANAKEAISYETACWQALQG